MSRIPNVHLRPNDKSVDRNRVGRLIVFLSYLALTLFVCVGGSMKIGSDWFGWYGEMFGLFLGLAVSVIVFSVATGSFFITVDLVSAFVTTDLLYTLFWHRSQEMPTPEKWQSESEEEKARDRKAFPTYGPGLHLAYPWERRERENNFSLKEIGSDFRFPILVTDGLLYVEGSYRIRPDLRNLIPFLSGVATMADELQDLIVSSAFSKLSSLTVDEATEQVGEINEKLYAEFGLDANGTRDTASDAVSNFERRFGVYVGDVTISRILPHEDLQKTRGGINEARAIATGTAILMGYPDAESMLQAKKAKEITDEQISRARDRFLSVSGNLEGMNVTRWEGDLNITGLDPETVQLLAKAAPAVARAFQGQGQKPKGKK